MENTFVNWAVKSCVTDYLRKIFNPISHIDISRTQPASSKSLFFVPPYGNSFFATSLGIHAQASKILQISSTICVDGDAVVEVGVIIPLVAQCR
jgi:hypothetical protein